MIKKVPSLQHDHSRKSEQIVLLDLKSEKAFTKRPWQGFMSTYAYFLVSTSDYHTVKGRVIELQDMRSGGKVNLAFDYRLKCKRGEEHLVVELIGKTEDPGADLERAILREIETCAYHKTENFLSNYDSFERYLKDHMYGWADSNGMTFEIHLTPQLDEPELLEGFEITLGEDKDWELTTIDSRIPVRLSISLHGRIVSFEGKLGDHLKTGERVLEKIKSFVISISQEYIHTVSPEKFYMQFEEAVTGPASVHAELSAQIRERLRAQFNLEISALTIRQKDTALLQRFRNLTAAFRKFDLEDNPKNIQYKIQYHVERVHKDGWAVFQSRNFGNTENELDAISENLRSHMKLHFDTYFASNFQGHKDEAFNKHIDNIFREASLKIAEDFGLVVKLTAKERMASPPEKVAPAQTQAEIDMMMKDIQTTVEDHDREIVASRKVLACLYENLETAKIAGDATGAAELEKLIQEEKKKNEGNSFAQKQQALDSHVKYGTGRFLADQNQ